MCLLADPKKAWPFQWVGPPCQNLYLLKVLRVCLDMLTLRGERDTHIGLQVFARQKSSTDFEVKTTQLFAQWGTKLSSRLLCHTPKDFSAEWMKTYFLSKLKFSSIQLIHRSESQNQGYSNTVVARPLFAQRFKCLLITCQSERFYNRRCYI